MNTTQLEERLTSRNIQPTAMRLMVLRYMMNQKAAVSLADLETDFERSDRITLYRTLKTFKDHGLVHEINDASGSVKYAICAENCTCSFPDDTHLHFFCSSCRRTSCFTHLSIPKISLPDHYTTGYANFVVTGLCPSCS